MRTKLLLSCLVFLTQFCVFAQTTIVIRPPIGAGKDAAIRSDFPTTNFGDVGDFIANAWTAGDPFFMRTYFDFDLSVLPAGVLITNATLSLYGNNGSGHHQASSGSNESWIKRVTTPWDEHTVTWNNQPQTTGLHAVTIPQSSYQYQNYPSIDLTQLIQDYLLNPESSFGMVFMLKTEQTYRCMLFCSNDYGDLSITPKLTITYTLPCNTLEGSVTYANAGSTPLAGVKVKLIRDGNVLADSTLTNESGHYSFTVCTPGNYTVVPTCTLPVNYINATDALIALKHFVGITTLEGVFFKAADVNQDNSVNSTDAMMILQRFIQDINTFPPGDWCFENPEVALPDPNPVVLNIKGLCYGDLDASRVNQ
ncbi:MAG: DNRLRE domain-containing protein [Bacteroidetes bacterium]|nr:DNRLRE domain-containing protein [Bacteroidota bacterium]